MNATNKTYQDNYQLYKEKTPNDVSGEYQNSLDEFLSKIPVNGTIFEIASAHGRDARYFREKGYTVFCTDIMQEALDELASDGFETGYVDVLDTIPETIGNFDGIFANAVLHHFTAEDFENIISQIYTQSNESVVFAFKVKEGVGDEIEIEKLGGERYFKYWKQDELDEVCRKFGWNVISNTLSSDGKWIDIILQK